MSQREEGQEGEAVRDWSCKNPEQERTRLEKRRSPMKGLLARLLPSVLLRSSVTLNTPRKGLAGDPTYHRPRPRCPMFGHTNAHSGRAPCARNAVVALFAFISAQRSTYTTLASVVVSQPLALRHPSNPQ